MSAGLKCLAFKMVIIAFSLLFFPINNYFRMGSSYGIYTFRGYDLTIVELHILRKEYAEGTVRVNDHIFE